MEPPSYTFQTFRVGARQFAVQESEIATIVDWRQPTPLPHAPLAVMGIVSLQGRMLTVLDLGKITEGDAAVNGTPRHIIALRGDEQLALAVHDMAAKFETSAVPLDGSSDSSGVTLSVLDHEGEQIAIVNVKNLFSFAIQGRERRQRRF
jgi:chemotaxis signal transduction protein